MNPISFDEIAKLFAARRLSRRQAMTRGATGLATAGLAAAGFGPAAAAADDRRPPAAAATFAAGEPGAFVPLEAPAPGATAVAAPVATGAKPLTFLFLQSFESGSLVPKAGSPGRYTLTLKQGLGDTVYFSDRPAKVVGTVPTDRFLQALGFTPANPPNAALVGQRDATHKDVVVLELFAPHYDATTNTLTYEVALLKDWHKLDETFQQTPDDEAQLPRQFTAAHLFIDDCPDANPLICVKSPGFGPLPCTPVGDLGNHGMCWSWNAFDCVPCQWGRNGAIRMCNDKFPACDGKCVYAWPC